MKSFASHPLSRPRLRRSLIAGATVVAALAVLPQVALAGEDEAASVAQTNLIANRAGYGAAKIDPNLVNAWGLSKLAASPVWISDNGADKTTLYAGGTPANPAGTTVVPLVVSVPGGPTGQLANTTSAFTVGNNAAARFIFVNEDGELYGWNQGSGTNAERKASVDGAVFKGVTEIVQDGKPYLLAANFSGGRVEIFDGAWTHVDWAGAFSVRHLPKDFAPFNVQTLVDNMGQAHVFVAYAKRNTTTNDEIAGRNLGLVVEYTTSGQVVRRFEREGLNAPWGLAYAPSSWGSVAGQLLVGQFGNGRIETFDTADGEHTGSLRDGHGRALAIEGLWGLMAGDITAGGAGTILFTAGPNDEADGLYGILSAVTAPRHGDD